MNVVYARGVLVIIAVQETTDHLLGWVCILCVKGLSSFILFLWRLL